MPETLAAVDVGTNSLHLVVARMVEGDRFEVITRLKEMVRLGGATSRSGDLGEMSDDAIERAVSALSRFKRLADSHAAPLRAVATSAVREASNRKVLLDRARLEAGIDIEVVSGPEEARLIHLGVLQALEVFDTPLLMFDIGGGSTELLLGLRGDVLASTSLKLGALRLTNRFFPGTALHPSSVDSCRRHIEELLSSFERNVREHGFEVVVGSSGTIEQMLRLARGLAGAAPLRTLNGAELCRPDVDRVVRAVIDARRDGTTSDLVGLDPKRTDIILAGALVLEGIMKQFAIEGLLISEHALREGVLLDTVARSRGGALPHLRDVARRSVHDLMRVCDDDPVHSKHVAGLALQIFDQLAPLHGLDSHARGLLEAGALLANVGLMVSHSQHHKHSYYVIRNTDRLVGFTDHEIELIALIARYHRRSAPKQAHQEWVALGEDDRAMVRTAAAVLRLAIGLDRAHDQSVDHVEIEATPTAIVVKVHPVAPGQDLALELYAARERVGLLTDTLGMAVELVLASA